MRITAQKWREQALALSDIVAIQPRRADSGGVYGGSSPSTSYVAVGLGVGLVLAGFLEGRRWPAL